MFSDIKINTTGQTRFKPGTRNAVERCPREFWSGFLAGLRTINNGVPVSHVMRLAAADLPLIYAQRPRANARYNGLRARDCSLHTR